MRMIPLFLMPVFALLAAPAIVLASAPPAPGVPLLVIAAWGAAAPERIEAAGGRVIGPLRARFGVLAVSDNPDFAPSLRAGGAWAVLDGNRFAAICGVNS